MSVLSRKSQKAAARRAVNRRVDHRDRLSVRICALVDVGRRLGGTGELDCIQFPYTSLLVTLLDYRRPNVPNLMVVERLG